MPKFSVITPSKNQAPWLRLAVASVADQTSDSVVVEHLVQDAKSTDDTLAFLQDRPGVQVVCEADSGMYDALNRGFNRATGDIFSYLNCDEQYLPGALEKVGDFFEAHPTIDLLFGVMIVVDGAGEYICSRKALSPSILHTRVCHLASFTCGMFFRRKVWERGFSFDPTWKSVGDAEWVARCLEQGVKVGVMDDCLAAFTDTGTNLGDAPANDIERNRLRALAPGWARSATPLVAWWHRVRRWRCGAYRLEPFSYAIYTQNDPRRRTDFRVDRPTALWKKRLTLWR